MTAALVPGLVLAAALATAGPLAFLRPAVTLTADEHARVDRGETVVRVLPGIDGQIAVFAASRLDAPPERMLERMRQIDQLKTSRFVPIVRRFSSPPVMADLAELTLEVSELDDLRRCRPGNCGVKLAADEIAALVPLGAGPRWREQLLAGYRHVVLARAQAFLERDAGALATYDDRSRPVRRSAVYDAIMQATPFLDDVDLNAGESFLYWATEQAAGKPSTTVSHVTLMNGTRDGHLTALAVSRQVYASHYANGALGVTAAVQSRDGTRTYLVYVNRTQIDVLGGLFGGLKRAIIERRIENETAGIFTELRRRIEREP
jgi:hypothetical protein